MKKEVDYSKDKINISIDKKLHKEIKKIIKYPQWKGNRSLLIETAVAEYIAGNLAKKQKI